MIRFFALPLSSCCAKVRIVLRLKEIEFEEVPPSGGHYTSEAYRRMVPSGSIPAIQDGDFVLHDSDAIVEYLEDTKPEPKMRPDDPQACAALRAIGRFHDTRLEPAVRRTFPLVANPSPPQTDDVVSTLDDLCGRLERMTSPAPYLWGERISLADCGFPTTLHMAEDILAATGRRWRMPAGIARWIGALEGEPIIGQAVSDNRAAIRHWIDGVKG